MEGKDKKTKTQKALRELETDRAWTNVTIRKHNEI